MSYKRNQAIESIRDLPSTFFLIIIKVGVWLFISSNPLNTSSSKWFFFIIMKFGICLFKSSNQKSIVVSLHQTNRLNQYKIHQVFFFLIIIKVGVWLFISSNPLNQYKILQVFLLCKLNPLTLFLFFYNEYSITLNI